MQHEVYSAGYGPVVLQGLATWSATRDATFFVPYLTSDRQVLDCGCGPGGIIGLRDANGDGEVYHPAPDDLERLWKLTERVIQHHGGDTRFGRKQRQQLREAGLQDIVASTLSGAFGTTELITGFSRYFGSVFLTQHRDLILKEG